MGQAILLPLPVHLFQMLLRRQGKRGKGVLAGRIDDRLGAYPARRMALRHLRWRLGGIETNGLNAAHDVDVPFGLHMEAHGPRSEERRVGKECRSRWSPYH